MLPAYADVILPLPLPGMFTYYVPEEFRKQIGIGKRVVVQFGARRMYTAIVATLHDYPPELHKPKLVLEVLDEQPVVEQIHLDFWNWIADYYMSSLGEVMNVALPQGLKLDSETAVSLSPEWDDSEPLPDEELIITRALAGKESLGIENIQTLLKKKQVWPLIKSMLDKNIVQVHEELVERYRPKTETYVELAEELKENDAHLHEVLDSLKRAGAQQKVLLAYLQLTEKFKPVKKSEVMSQSDTNSAVVKKLMEKGILHEVKIPVDRLRLDVSKIQQKQFELSQAQQTALAQINSQFEKHDVALLHGVTSGGKTQLYMELIKKETEQGNQVLYLLPEIALTAQIVNRLREVFGEKVGVYHSRFNSNERVEIWNKTLKEQYQIVLGARSALLLPFKNLGLIIVDEEHDASFKQFDPAPHYHARDAAIVLAKKFNAKTLLGTATPSFESYNNAQTGKYGYVQLTERYGAIELPEIKVVDVLLETKKKKMKSHFSETLIGEMKNVLDKKEQVILFQNRRGFAPYMMCVNCSWIPKCKNCDVSLSYHKFAEKLKCHYCGYTTPPVKNCGQCGSADMRILGFGTEKVEDEIAIYFPEAKIARLDYDATRTKEAHSKIINDFAEGKVDILVGTQMVTKGLDFDNVSLVGILSADQLLNFPDFRANERGFQMIEQVSGRAGRKNKRGKVFIQAFDAQHPVIGFVLQHDFEKFFRVEMTFRTEFGYPPLVRLIQITLKHRSHETVAHAAREFGHYLQQNISGSVLGPSIPLISRIKNMFLQEILVKMSKGAEVIAENKAHIRNGIAKLNLNPEFKSVRVKLDVDP